MQALAAVTVTQVEKFNSSGILAALITGESCNKKVKRGVRAGKYDVVFFTPELLINCKRWRSMLTMTEAYQHHLKGLVIDEAHCVKKW